MAVQRMVMYKPIQMSQSPVDRSVTATFRGIMPAICWQRVIDIALTDAIHQQSGLMDVSTKMVRQTIPLLCLNVQAGRMDRLLCMKERIIRSMLRMIYLLNQVRRCTRMENPQTAVVRRLPMDIPSMVTSSAVVQVTIRMLQASGTLLRVLSAVIPR